MPAGGYKLPKGQDVMISIYNLHHSPAGGPRSLLPARLQRRAGGARNSRNQHELRHHQPGPQHPDVHCVATAQADGSA